ncbi:MAG: HI0074 family nucleotidyltransferase substrate-binding subunit [Selenomonadaceae bacterium]|nr:HI0074 family nucleotidyltransferase substrate-binding subunit [Selenomonadaceae bacterium]
MAYNLDKQLEREIISAAKKFRVKKLILFGSRARGTNHARSDIDLAVSGGDISNFAETLDEKIDTLLPFDVINLDEGVDADFQAEIDRDGIILYEEVSPAVKKLDAFAKSLAVLSKSNRATTDEIYRMGIIGQFHLTFELSWKALREILLLHGVSEAASGSPREIIKAGYQFHFLDDENLWLDMLKRRNLTTHVYNEDIADELVTLIFEKYIAALENLRDELNQRFESVQ